MKAVCNKYFEYGKHKIRPCSIVEYEIEMTNYLKKFTYYIVNGYIMISTKRFNDYFKPFSEDQRRILELEAEIRLNKKHERNNP